MAMTFAIIVMSVWIGIGYWLACHEAPDGTYILNSNYIYMVTLCPVYLIFAGFYWLICVVCWKIEDLRR